ncbi:MAG TPA: hypothetical protein VJQ52_12865 [Steroidobacteraceae bacterium]|nr:hypothetical protein [Steroidobacteraceae bacterium]
MPQPFDLPLLLAGPIVRRVEPTLASVWVALSEPADVTLKIWEGRVGSGSGNVLNTGDPAPSLRAGDKLHIALPLIKILPTSPRLLEPGKIYSYDLEIKTATQTHTLKSLGLLTTGVVNGRRVEALGFEENALPGFVLPPAEITDLHVIFGSCRRVNSDHLDAMVWIDDLMAEKPDENPYSYKEASKRPHQLFLGGDQIYADDVGRCHLHMLIDLGKRLIGTSNSQPSGEALETLLVDSIRKNSGSTPTKFEDYGAPLTRLATQRDDFVLPADHAWFPPGRRYLQSVVEAQMTSTDGQSHLFAFGEFAAMYLSVWSNAVWTPNRDPLEPKILDLPNQQDVMDRATWPDTISTFVGCPLNAQETRDVELPGDSKDEKNRKALSPFRDETYLDYDKPSDGKFEDEKGQPCTAEQHFQIHLKKFRIGLQNERIGLTSFHDGLAKVRRAMANIPTYMIFDDHDFTDDWNLNPMWYDRVYATSLGVTSARNALASYVLFQDWGNDPIKYEKKDDYKKLLATISQMFPQGQRGPHVDAATELDTVFGFRQPNVTDPLTGSVAARKPIITWHYSVPGPKHLAVAIDNRTRRSFLSRLGPPGNIEGSLDPDQSTAQTEQVPAGPFTDGKEVLLVIAPLQVIGPPLLDELVAPAAFRAFDIKAYSKKLDPDLKFGSRGMSGTDPDAIEAWAFDPVTLEAFLARLKPYRQVVLLSGDVHYSASTVMTYFTKGETEPVRFVQFTSSGFKNVMPSYITVIDRSIALAHLIVRQPLGAERMGWLRRPPHPIVLEAGTEEGAIPREYRAKLKEEPTLLPTLGWPDDTTIDPAQRPDWSWRAEPIFDLRADADRPPPIQLKKFSDPPEVETALAGADAATVISGYQAVAARQQRSLETLKNSRQILFRSNFGLVRFERRADGVLHAVHEMYTGARLPEEAGTEPLKPQLFVLHEAALAVTGAVRPEDTLVVDDDPVQP